MRSYNPGRKGLSQRKEEECKRQGKLREEIVQTLEKDLYQQGPKKSNEEKTSRHRNDHRGWKLSHSLKTITSKRQKGIKGV